MNLFAIPGIIKQSPWQLDFSYLHTVMTLPERHTDVSLYGFEISIPKCIKNHHFIFKKIKTRDKQLSNFRTS